MNLQVGIDPTGGNNPWSPNIIWSAPAESFDTFTQFVVEAVAKNNVVSVWTKSKPDMPLQHVDVYVDEASLNVVKAGKTAKAAPAKTTKIITSTKVVTGTNGITSTVIVTRTIVVTPVPTKSTASTKAMSGTVAASTTAVTGTLPIPASGTYTVVKGDSLSKIARRFGISLATILALNNISDPNRIEPGLVLKLK
jgi:LysM repeat protein